MAEGEDHDELVPFAIGPAALLPDRRDASRHRSPNMA